MTTPYIITRSPKSTGIAILLTFLFGSIGLFYASVLGGFVMTFLPVILLIVGYYYYFEWSILNSDYSYMEWMSDYVVEFAVLGF